jgi:hypothetical protein
MRPYLAILHDSFRSALASRVLLVMLVLISVFLLVAAPAGYEEQLTTEILPSDIVNPGELAVRSASGADLEDTAPLRRVWDRLSPSLQKSIEKYTNELESKKTEEDKEKQPKAPDMGILVYDLNKILNDREFYSTNAWPRIQLLPEARTLIDAEVDTLNDEQLMRLNRLLLVSTFPSTETYSRTIKPGPQTSIRFVYGPIDTGWVVPLSNEQLQTQVNTFLPWFIDTFLLSIGLLIAAIVTAPLIPQTFEPGSLTLQLSKPISRSLLFLSKFAGGCAFTLLCATYLFIGVVLVLGIRWGIWEPKILWCIPIYVFVFAIYYTVSAFAGLIWRNTIVSVIVVMGFWLMCFLIGTAKGIWQGLLDFQSFKQLAVLGEDVIAIDERNVPRRWDEASNEWKEALLTEDEERQVAIGVFSGPLPGFSVGPIADPQNGRLVVVKKTWSDWKEQAQLEVASAEDGFELQMISEVPVGTFLVAPEKGGTILAVSSDGKFYRVSMPEAGETGEVPKEKDDKNVVVCGPSDEVSFAGSFVAAMNPDSGVLATYSRGTIWLFKTNGENEYERVATKKLDSKKDALTSLAFAGDALLVAQNNGKLHLLDGTTLEERKVFEPETSTDPRHVRAAPGGDWFAVVYHSGALWLIDVKAGEIRKADVKGQGEISAIEFSGSDRLLVCDGGRRVFEYSVGDEQLQREYSPTMGMGERLYRWIVLPVYTVSPKPREFYQTTQYLLLEKKNLGSGRQMSARQAEIHPWRPVWSSLIFMVVMLGLACLYVERQEF